MHDEHAIRAAHFTALYLAAYGVLLFAFGRSITKTSAFFRWQPIDAQLRPRLASVLRERDALEQLPNVGPVYALISFVIAALVWFGVLRVEFACGTFIFAIGLVMALTYAQIRRAANAPRAAILAPRSPVSAIPLWAYGACALSLAGLVLAHQASAVLGEVAVLLTMAVMFYCGYAMAALPALLVGSDIEVEHYVERHVRTCRAMMMFYYASAATWAYVELATPSAPSALQFAAIIVSGISAAGFTLWFLAKAMQRKRLPRPHILLNAFGIF